MPTVRFKRPNAIRRPGMGIFVTVEFIGVELDCSVELTAFGADGAIVPNAIASPFGAASGAGTTINPTPAQIVTRFTSEEKRQATARIRGILRVNVNGDSAQVDQEEG